MTDGSPDFTVEASGPLSITCFRYCPAGLAANEPALDRLNRRLLNVVQQDGDVFLTGTELSGRFVLRVRRAYTEEQIEKLWSGNVLRVMDRAQQIARDLQPQ